MAESGLIEPEWDIFQSQEMAELFASTDASSTCEVITVKASRSFAELRVLIRPIPGTDLFDGQGTYGFSGPSGSVAPGDEPAIARGIVAALADLGLVSFFCRLDPFSTVANRVAMYAGTVERSGALVEIVLDGYDSVHLSMSASVRRDVRRAQREGVVARVATTGWATEFGPLYRQTMARRRAEPRYFFSDEYFQELEDRFGEQQFAVFAEHDERALSAAVLLIGGNTPERVGHYFLAANDLSAPVPSSSKLVIQEAAVELARRGARLMNLGGGLGGADDDLLKFKRGFSDLMRPSYVWKVIVSPDHYRSVAGDVSTSGFFPAYRRP